MSRRSAPVQVGDTDRRSAIGSSTALLCLLASSSIVVSLMGFSAALRRSDLSGGLALYFVAQVVLVVGCAWLVVFAQLQEWVLRWVAVSFTVLPALMYRLREPLLVTGYDEQQHYRGLVDLLATGHLGSPNPLLPITASFPGLEALAGGLHTLTGMPVMMSITTEVLLARALLGLALFEGARAVGASPDKATLVAVLYGACPQFFFFNNQFAYQTLALALGLAGLVLVRLAENEVGQPGGRRRQLLLTATLALAGCAMTHHVTSWFIAGFAVVWWLLTRRGPRRTTVRTGAACAVGTVLCWSGAVATGLYHYLAPVFIEAKKQFVAVAHGQSQRSFSADAAGVTTPVWERVALLLYALTVVALAVGAAWWLLRPAWRERSRTRLLVGVLALAAPAVFAGRVSPALSQIGDRSSTFTFLPWALVTGMALGSLLVRARRRGWRSPLAAGLLASVLLLVIGGDLLGSGPDWEKLPGPWLAAAENRSLDSETLAAAVWARRNLPAGSRVVADRIPSVVLAGRSQLWSVTQSNSGLNLADLYFSAQWGPSQRDVVRRARLAYLYVDRRLATQPSHVGVYFSDGEAIGRPSSRLSRAQLLKFDRIQGLQVVYAHGPVRIYRVDPFAFSVRTELSGQTSRRQLPAQPWHALVGLVLGAGLAAARARRPPRPQSGAPAAGDHLVRLAWVVGGGTVVSTALFAAHVVPDRWFLLGIVGPHLVHLARSGARPRPVAVPFRVVFLTTVFVATAVLWVVNVVVASRDTNVLEVDRIVAQVEAGQR